MGNSIWLIGTAKFAFMNGDDEDGLIDLLDEIKSIAPSPRLSSASPTPQALPSLERKNDPSPPSKDLSPKGVEEPKWQHVQAAALNYFKVKFANPVRRVYF